jgi:hypothetical protein
MRRLYVTILIMTFAIAAAFAQTVPTPDAAPAANTTIQPLVLPDPPLQAKDITFFLGTGSGFKPYQTSVKAGASAFVQGGMKLQDSLGLYGFARVDLFSTYAQMVVEGCKSIVTKSWMIAMACGGPGFGADSNSLGIAFAGTGKMFFSPAKVRKHNIWVDLEIGVDKSTVPAPVQTTGTSTAIISPVQPTFRLGIHTSY